MKKILAWCILVPILAGILTLFVMAWKITLMALAFFGLFGAMGWAIGEVVS